jgi:ATP-dependent RNA helicase RhlE
MEKSMTMESAASDAEVVRSDAEAGARKSLQPETGVAMAAGRDVLGIQPDEGDRTAAFTTPLIAHLQAQSRPRNPHAMRVLVVMPTREIAARIESGLRQSLEPLGLTSLLVQGGADYTAQAEALAGGVDVLVATTGRLLDHLAKGTALLQHLELMIVDGADRMRDIRFLRDVHRIVEGFSEPRQTVLLSAVASDDVREFAAAILRDPVVLEIRSAADTEGAAQPRHARQPPSRRQRGSQPRDQGQRDQRDQGQRDPGQRDPGQREQGPRDQGQPEGERRQRDRDRQPISHESSLFPSSGPVFGYGDNRGGNRRPRGGSGRRGGNY